MKLVSPYREVEHTADWALEVWAPTLEGLYLDAARGMFHLAGFEPAAETEPGPPQPLALEAGDREALLVAWLQELLYLSEAEDTVYADLKITALTPTRMEAVARGWPAAPGGKTIKAVTYHNLHIREGPGQYTVTIVFDV
jgi:SHS2 domain-containing protein